MKDQKRLKCLDCGFESDNLVAHIERNCDSDARRDLGLLESYMRKHNKKESDVIVSDDFTAIESVSVPKGNGKGKIPTINPSYLFGRHAPDVLMDITENRRVMLVGHTGCGKTSLIEQIAARANQGVERVNLNGQTTIGDFVGLWTVKGGETIWVDGSLPKAMREGLWLILDEIDFAETAILAVLNPVLEKDGALMLKEKGHELVIPHKNFRIFATGNTIGKMQKYRGLYQGTNIMNEAFLDRWRCYMVEYLQPQEEIAVLSKTIDRISEKLAAPIVRVANEIRQAFLKEEISCTFSTRRLIDWAELMLRTRNPLKAADIAIFSKISEEDAEVVKGIIVRVMGVKPSEGK